MAARQPIVFGAPDAGAGPPVDPAEPGPPADPAEQDREKHRLRCPPGARVGGSCRGARLRSWGRAQKA